MAENEYIERGALDRDLQKLVKEYNRNCESDKSSGAFEALYRLRLAPAADVAPVVHGKWKLHTNGDGTCDQCGFRQAHIWDYDNWQNYCGVCGAKMDGGKEATP